MHAVQRLFSCLAFVRLDATVLDVALLATLLMLCFCRAPKVKPAGTTARNSERANK